MPIGRVSSNSTPVNKASWTHPKVSLNICMVRTFPVL